MPKVYVTQLPHRRDKETQTLVPAFNLNPAIEHGELNVMMPAQSAFQATSDLVRQLSEKLSKYSYVDGDSLLLLGDSSIIAASVGILAKHHERFAILRWDRNLARYTRVVLNV